jgi:NADH dehydrogenase
VSHYGESKRRGELAVVAAHERWVVVRPPVIYGPNDAATRLLFRQALLPFAPVPRRALPLSLLHVDDVVAALLAAATAAANRAFVALDGPERSDSHALLRAIAQACGRRARLVPVPMFAANAAAAASDLWGYCTRRPSFLNLDKMREVRQVGWVADGSAARAALGFSPRVALKDGLRRVAEDEGHVPRARALAAD